MYDRRCVARLGDILVKLGLCTPEQVQSALAAQVLYGARLGTNLIELGHVNLDNLARGLARRLANRQHQHHRSHTKIGRASCRERV